MRPMKTLPLCLAAFLAVQCTTPPAPEAHTDTPDATRYVPAWAKEAVWYQVFVERFHNGDPSNDPTLHDIEGAYPDEQPAGWHPTPWTHAWYEQEEWARTTGDFYYTVQLRRYGGDLQGLLDRLDYLENLGVTALYLNPINDAPSLHKYDARTYRHVDRNFGPDPRGDEALMAREDPVDPGTWQWSAADSLFLRLVDEVHRRGMRIILDYSWNHTGITFWAWQDVLANQESSPYAAWYQVNRFDDPGTPEDEFDYEGWAGVRTLPNLTKVDVPAGYRGGPAEGNLHPAVKQHVFNVTRRWLDPDGDGDPADGIDGFRLDVAEQVPLGFWREYRRFVRSINPEAYLVGEVWWEQWPDRMAEPEPYLGDVFDAVMNYRWYMPTRSFLAHAVPSMNATAYVAHLDSVESGIAPDNLLAMMNLTASHDSPRFGTSVYNNRVRYKAGVNPRDTPDYKIDRPDGTALDRQKLILVQQFTYYGAPHIWNGDEAGMWGADDPDNRKPLVWADLSYEEETSHPFGRPRPRNTVAPDTALFRFYQRLIALRRTRTDLFVYGALEYVLVDDERGLLAYMRTHEDEQALVVFNTADQPQQVSLPASSGPSFEDALRPERTYPARDGHVQVNLPPRQAAVLLRRL
jgi:glycosidase